jgi:hypothetical protein
MSMRTPWVVLNKANIDQLSNHDPVGRNYYRNKYYPQYGLTDRAPAGIALTAPQADKVLS